MLGFLANLGSGLARLGSGFAHCAASVGKGIGRGVKRLGELGDEEMGQESPDMFRTPDFYPNTGYPGQTLGVSPNEGRGVRGPEDAVASAENQARADFGPAA